MASAEPSPPPPPPPPSSLPRLTHHLPTHLNPTGMTSVVDTRPKSGGEVMSGRRRGRVSVVAGVLLFLVSVGGGAVLVWWVLQFHPDNRQQWMVPVGLVMFGTPVVVWFSVFASEFWRRVECSAATAPPVVNPVVVVAANAGGDEAGK